MWHCHTIENILEVHADGESNTQRIWLHESGLPAKSMDNAEYFEWQQIILRVCMDVQVNLSIPQSHMSEDNIFVSRRPYGGQITGISI